MKVLLSAFGCGPGEGSEPGVGWGSAQQIARFHEVWVLTWRKYQAAIEGELSSNPLPNAHFVYLALPRWRGIAEWGSLGEHIFYHVWQIAAYFLGRKLHRRVHFDLVHHVTLVCYWRPSFLALLPVPFVWGSVGGGESAPYTFWRSFSLRGKIFELARDLTRKLGEIDPFVRHSARKAVLGLATTDQTAKRMRVLGCHRVEVVSEAALAHEELEELGKIPLRTAAPFRVLSLGRLLHFKGFHLGLTAFAEFRRANPGSEYWIVGDGPERARLERLAHSLGLDGIVHFWGSVNRSSALEMLANCDVLVHPSLHDSGGWVCLEAMAAGRPVICLDLGGPAFQVTKETGIKVPAISPDQAVSGLTQALSQLATDLDLRAKLGAAGRRRVKDYFDWDKKGQFLTKAYEGLLRKRSLSHAETVRNSVGFYG